MFLINYFKLTSKTGPELKLETIHYRGKSEYEYTKISFKKIKKK